MNKAPELAEVIHLRDWRETQATFKCSYQDLKSLCRPYCRDRVCEKPKKEEDRLH